MTERQIVNWLLGFVIGILTVLAWQRVMNEPLLQSDSEATRAEELISIYKRGVRDALKTNPVSFELEQVCLEVWANKQPVAGQSINVDPINHPPHYTFGGIETIEYMKAKSTPEEFKGHLRLTVLKYLSRTGHKNDALEDLKKGKWYLDRHLAMSLIKTDRMH
jgi:hypothetical protein